MLFWQGLAVDHLIVILHRMRSFCFPVLFYCLESISDNMYCAVYSFIGLEYL